ncbi:MAG: hypothetical protein A4E53_03045 [Pelotomaculum sp. PtaB.Bin104]|nr:MAG: hypothetical protein A4E53_03045 [Pelotomaculum sp. PtaB.Bin104]
MALKDCKPSSSLKVYNPWRDFDGIYDIGKEAPEIRCKHLENYLRHRVPGAKYIFVAEAVGFQGGHFSGIAMTSERILLGHHKNKKLQPSLVISCNTKRTSNPGHISINKTQSKMGYNEPTATIVWESIIDSKRNPFDVILWNMYPFHPYQTGLLTNRTPSDAELREGIKYLNILRGLVQNAEIVAIGLKSHQTLTHFGIKHYSVRHPANGGASEYRQQIADLLK